MGACLTNDEVIAWDAHGAVRVVLVFADDVSDLPAFTGLTAAHVASGPRHGVVVDKRAVHTCEFSELGWTQTQLPLPDGQRVVSVAMGNGFTAGVRESTAPAVKCAVAGVHACYRR